MRNVIFTSIFITVLFNTNYASAEDISLKNIQTNIELPICGLIANNDKSRFHQILQNKNVKIREIFYGTECNGQNILKFSLQNHADNVSKYIINRLPKHSLTKVMHLLEGQDELASIANRKLSNWNITQI